MNAGTSGIKILLLSIILILQTQNVFAQSHYLDNYPGIPIMAHTNITANQITPENLAKMKELGVMGFYATDLSPQTYNTITQAGLKVFPYQLSGDNWIVYYTDAVYSKWEAEGKGDGSNGDMQLFHNTSISSTFTEDSVEGIKTNSSNAGNIIFGPYYYQYVEYKQLAINPNDKKIRYTADFKLKIVNNIPIQDLPSGYENVPVCTLKVVATNPTLLPEQQEHTIVSRELIVRDFLPPNGNGWNQWKPFSIENYNLTTLINLSEQQLKGVYYISNSSTTSPTYDSRWMQYKIDWSGVSFLDLYVDNIIVSDSKGRLIKDNTTARNQVKTLVAQYPDASNVLGWFGLNEPFSIDNYEPFRIVDDLVQDTSSNLHLYTTFTSGWGGIYGMPYPGSFGDNGYVYKGTEFIKRSKLPYLSINLYNYNYPITPSMRSTYYLENIEYVTTENLHKLDSAGIPISYSIQSGRFFDFNTNCVDEFQGSILPSSEQMLYHINLGLLYGMEELTCDPLFTLYNSEAGRPCPDSLYRAGLINYSDNSLTSLGLTWKNKVAPRMSGLAGKLIRNITPINQILNAEYLTWHHYLNLLIHYYDSGYGSDFDLGFYIDSEEKNYFILLNRWYNSGTLGIPITFNSSSIGSNNNIQLFNLIDSTKQTIQNNSIIYTDIELGDILFYSVTPVVKYGGNIAYNDTIKSNTVLTDNMTINDSKTIIINYEKVYTIQDTVTLIGTGFITGDGYLNLTSTGEIIINNWNYSLFKSRNDNHPKLVWGKYPGSFTVSYYSIYRKIGSGNWQFLANTTNRNYTDSYLTIVPPSGQAGTIVYYKILAVFSNETQSQYSNTVEYDCTSKQIGKKAGGEEIIYTYNLAQNYPNPFNPVTTINYSLTEDGYVDLEIVDILGRKVVVLLNEFQTKGSHTINFDASQLPSGVYVYKLQAGSFISSKKMILLK